MRKALLFLGILSDGDLDWLVANGTRERLARGAVVITQGQPIAAVYVVLDGVLAVTVGAGREVARLRTGEIVGELSFVDARPPSAHVTAIEDALILAVPRARLEARLDSDAAFAARFYHAIAVLLADRLRATTSHLAYGDRRATAAADAEADDDEIEPGALDRVAIAGARFDWLLRRLRGY
jgi:CRP/FNR family transcriptional regulator, cyclic AMP receptor protein